MSAKMAKVIELKNHGTIFEIKAFTLVRIAYISQTDLI